MSGTQTAVAAKAAPPVSASSALRLQRKCACGGSTELTGECEECQKKKLLGQPLQYKLVVDEPGDEYEREADRFAKLPGTPLVQRYTTTAGSPGLAEAPPIVRDARASPDRLLDPATGAFMEPRVSYDFSQVRVHAAAAAARTAPAASAQAFTAGRDMVVHAGEHAPWIGGVGTHGTGSDVSGMRSDRLVRHGLGQAGVARWQTLARSVPRRQGTTPPPGGRPLYGDARARLERGFGTPLGGIVVHDDAAAHKFVSRRRAQAVTIGNHIYLSEARRDPDRGGNFRVLAHEVAHTLQQGSGGAETGINDPQLKRRLEREADTAALRIAAGDQTQVSSRQIGPTPQHLDESGTNSSPNLDASPSAGDRYSAEKLMTQGEQLLGRLRGMEADTLSMPTATVERINANYARLREQVGSFVPLPDEVLSAAPGSYFVQAAPAVVAPAAVAGATLIPLWVVIAIVAALVVLLILAALVGYWLIKWIFDDVEEAVEAPPLQTQPELEPTAGEREAPTQTVPQTQEPSPKTQEPSPKTQEPTPKTQEQTPRDITIRRPDDPGGGRCACNCRAGDASDPSSFRYAVWTAATCGEAAKTACSIAIQRAGVANIHHAQAKCSDGGNYSGSGRLAR